MRRLFTTILCAGFAFGAYAQVPSAASMDNIQKTAKAQQGTPVADTVKAWKRSGNVGISLSQASFSDWSAGGDPSIAADLLFNYSADYKKGKHLWTNRLELAYGLSNTGSVGTRKTNDKIYLSSNYGYKIGKKWYAGAMLTFNTQFANGYDYKISSTDYISRFMAPGYLTFGLGFTYTPNSWFSLVLSPTTWRGTFVLNDKLSALGAYGVTPGKRMLNEFGAQVRAELNTTVWKKFGIYSRLELYSNYLKDPQNIDINWSVQLNYALSGSLTASLQLNMIYDDNVKFGVTPTTPGIPRIQFKEVLGIGLQAKF